MLSSSGACIRDQDVTAAITPIDGKPQIVLTPSEELATQISLEASSRATLPVEVEESSLRRTAEVKIIKVKTN